MTPGSVNRAIVADKTALIRRLLDGVRTLPLDDLDTFTADPRMVAAGESYLRRALEALLDVARHILAKGFARGPTEYAEVARQLGESGVVSRDQSKRLVLMARYRNRLVHVYDQVTDAELYELLARRLGDIEEIIGEITTWMAGHPERCTDRE